MYVQDTSGNVLRAHCPNPGKLTEFLIPGQPLLIERHSSPNRKTDCTAAAVLYQGKIIYLYSARANSIAGQLIIPEIHPGRTILAEQTIGTSRFDFLLPGQVPVLMEVKSCSLVEHHRGMFPDAPTERGIRHVDELGKLAGEGYQSEVLFVISHEDAQWFMPNPHTDPLFCRRLHEARPRVQLRAASAAADEQGYARVIRNDIPVETQLPFRLAEANCGAYLLVLQVTEELHVPVKSINTPRLKPGWYIYAGSARQHLTQRIQRHLRKRKARHWHIDHLTQAAASVKAFPVRSFLDLECSLSQDIAAAAYSSVPGFGCSDCSCPSHLHYFSTNPLHSREVLEVIFAYRHLHFYR